MAKHMVKCLYCGEIFDTSAEPFVKPNSCRYAHKSCAESVDKNKTKEQKDKEQLEKYIKDLFGINCISIKIKKQMEDYHIKKNYSYSGMYKTLKYFFEIKKNPIEKANGGIGIIPYVYDEAYKYWKALWEAQEKNQNIKIQEYILPVKEIHILTPQRKTMSNMSTLFNFLDKGGEE